MTCDLSVLLNNIQPHPCTKEATDRNWDAIRKIIDILNGNDIRLEQCISAPPSTDSRIQPFELTAPLALGGSAAAKKMSRSGAAWVLGTAITVKDAWDCGGRFWGDIGRKGLAYYDPTTGEYIVFFLQTVARYIRYTLNETLIKNPTPGGIDNAEAAVADYWDGCSPGANVDVYDPRGIFRKWHCKGCSGVAVYNERQGRYEILDPQLMSKFLKVTNDQDLCAVPAAGDEPPYIDDGGGESVGSSTLSMAYKQAYYSAAPKKLDGSDWTVFDMMNSYSHISADGGKILLMGYDDGEDETEIQWEMIDVTKVLRRTLDIPDPFEWNTGVDDHCKLYSNTYLTAVEACDLVEANTLPIPWVSTDVIDDFYLDSGYSPDRCKLWASTKKYCMIDDNAAGADVLVVEFSRHEAITDVYYDTMTHKLMGTVGCFWVPCYQDTAETEFVSYTEKQYVVSFSTTDTYSPEACKIVATREKAWVIESAAGTEVTVAEMTKREVAIDIDLSSTELTIDTEYHWVLCWDAGSTVQIATIEQCEE